MPQSLLPIFPSECTPINELVSFCNRNGMVYYFHGCMPVFTHPEDDMKSFRMFTSQLVVNGNCKQVEIVRALGISEISMKRYVKKYRERGVASFFERPRRRGPSVLRAEVIAHGQQLLSDGWSREQVADRLGLKKGTLAKAIQAGRLVEHKKNDEMPTSKSERSVADSQTAMGTACRRVVERVCAAVGVLDGAPTQFETSLDVPNGGVLWALPALLANGLLRHTEEFFSLPKGFYRLVQVFLLLAYMALARVKTMERLRYLPPGEWGALLGLDRIPEVRTLRRKVKILAQPQRVRDWTARLSKDWMDADPAAAGVLYVDGHVRVYHGSQTPLPRRYVARERLCLRATMDYWVNDQQGRPFFVVSTPFTDGLLAMLREQIVPRLLAEVPNQPSRAELDANPYLSRFTLVFDREGYSPEFFREMWAHRIACQTYHKYPEQAWPTHEFRQHLVTLAHAERTTMMLAERGVKLSNGFWMRQIRKLTKTGHQVAVLSTEYQSEASLIGVHMFSRWSQENFIKYMMQHFSIDRLVDYETIGVDETHKVVNPTYRQLASKIRSKAATRARKLAQFGEISLQQPGTPRQIQRYQTQKATLKEEIDLLEKDLLRLKEQRKHSPKHIPLNQLPKQEQFLQLAPSRKQFIDTIKMIAYRAETAMAIILRDHLAHSNETRSLLRELFTTEADLVPNQVDQTLTVRLHHLTNPLSDRAIQSLAHHLNASETIYPGTNLRLIYKLVSE